MLLYSPAGQFSQAERSALGILPALQYLHVEADVLSLYWSGGQSVQNEEPPTEYFATGHSEQEENAANFPGPQYVHVASLPA
jgi:hypothetical protein